MSAKIFHGVERYDVLDVEKEKNEDSEHGNVSAFLPPSTTTADPRGGADKPALSQPVPDDQQQGARSTTTAIVSVPRSAAGDPGHCFSKDMDRTVLEDEQIKTPPSKDESTGSIK